ncbi:MAG: N-6 DNA methylase [Verrucomicrobiota bacterium]|nr:N-6 DNA methylase [Verrucomicrobiota bacterium]
MNLVETHQLLSWPSPERILKPSGGGMSHLATIAQAKIGTPLTRVAISENGTSKISVRTGLLVANPESEKTEAPLAIICEFNRNVSPNTLQEAHRLAWNFSHAPILVTLEPGRILLWSCCVRPLEGLVQSELNLIGSDLAARLIAVDLQRSDDPLSSLVQVSGIQKDATTALHWVNLLAGKHFSEHPGAFKSSGRLDETLIQNLVFVRNHLRDALGLPEKRCHDLLARLIFIQFLFQRTDSCGRAALHVDRLRSLAKEGILGRVHAGLPELLADYEDCYHFFEWLNERFNGDLFPGKADTPEERKKEWEDEKSEVKPMHLEFLSRFITGREELRSGQALLWQQYAFDVIPLELISSIYEMFVGPPDKDKAYYTPGRMVDFMLDAVLPWKGDRSDLKVLDPSCGSGIFLVKAFQRLAHRLRISLGTEPKPNELRNLLSNQIFGVDINPEAVRVAAFSLYLSFCDELDPRYYWSREKLLPLLRGINLLDHDFFVEQSPIHSQLDAGKFDLVIGNAPWGKSSAKDIRSDADGWAKRNGWTVPSKDHGPVFLAKAAKLAKPDGWVSMIQPGGLLLNRSKPTQEFRRKLISSFTIEEIINLSAIRRDIFAKAIGACCVVTFNPQSPKPSADFAYVTPKPQSNAEDRIRIVIEPQDIHFISQEEAVDDLLWSVLMWGGRRDLELIRRVSKGETIENLITDDKLLTREGLIRGKASPVSDPLIVDRHYLSDKECPPSTNGWIDAGVLPVNHNPMVHRKDKGRLRAFDTPQLLFKQSWRAETGRFDAVLVKPDSQGKGALCSDSYVSVRDLEGKHDVLTGLWLMLRSSFAPYWFALTSGQFAGFIPKATETELRQIPALRVSDSKLVELVKEGTSSIDDTVMELLKLSPAEKILVEDLHQTVLPDAQRQGGNPPGLKPATSSELEAYASTFLKVLSATYGRSVKASATVFHATGTDVLPFQLIAIELNSHGQDGVVFQELTKEALWQQLVSCHENLLGRTREGIGYQRIVEVILERQHQAGVSPALFLLKPNQRRYWLRSLAMRDADRLGPLLFSSIETFR